MGRLGLAHVINLRALVGNNNEAVYTDYAHFRHSSITLCCLQTQMNCHVCLVGLDLIS